MKLVLCLVLLASGFSLQDFDNSDLFASSWSVKRLVEYHQHLRPSLQVQDVYKMLYQAHFGVEHFLTDSTAVRSYLRDELASLDTIRSDEPLLERISTQGDVVRVNLRPFKALNLPMDTLVQLMFQSASTFQPDSLNFSREWNEFCDLVRYDMLKFPLSDVKEWAARVQPDGVQPVHHSDIYSKASKPAYRVVERALFESRFNTIGKQPGQ